jgi:hypothetical protein
VLHYEVRVQLQLLTVQSTQKPMSDIERRIIRRQQRRMLKCLGRLYHAAYVTGRKESFLEDLYFAWFSLFPPANCQIPYHYNPNSFGSEEERQNVKVCSALLLVCPKVTRVCYCSACVNFSIVIWNGCDTRKCDLQWTR